VGGHINGAQRTGTDGQLHKKTAFFVRTGNSTRELDATEKAKYVLGRWPASNAG
jgi:hypothetical protein